MVTLNVVEKFLNKCECQDPITVTLDDDCLNLYRFDGEMVDDEVLIATIDKDFTVNIPNGGSHSLSIDDFDMINEDLESIEEASVEEVVEAILSNLKVAMAVDTGVTHANMSFIDEIMENNNMKTFEVSDTYGHTCRIYKAPKKDYLSVTIVKCSDWQALYIEGEKKYEGHNIDVDLALFDLINSAIYEYCGGSIESIDFGTLFVEDDYAENGLPERLEDIPDEVIE